MGAIVASEQRAHSSSGSRKTNQGEAVKMDMQIEQKDPFLDD